MTDDPVERRWSHSSRKADETPGRSRERQSSSSLKKRSYSSFALADRGATFQPSSGKWNTVFKPYRDSVESPTSFVQLFEACVRTNRTWKYAMVATQRSSRSIATPRRRGNDECSRRPDPEEQVRRPRSSRSPDALGSLGTLCPAARPPVRRCRRAAADRRVRASARRSPDAAFDSNAIIADLDDAPPRSFIAQRRTPNPEAARSTPDMYDQRHPDPELLRQAEGVQRIAMRADKNTTPSFSAAIHLAAAVINSR